MSAFDEPAEIDAAPLDTRRRFVRVTHERDDGFVEFNFSIGDPDIFLEMILGRAAFAEFCAVNGAENFPAETAETARPDVPDDWAWRLSDAARIRFK